MSIQTPKNTLTLYLENNVIYHVCKGAVAYVKTSMAYDHDDSFDVVLVTGEVVHQKRNIDGVIDLLDEWSKID